ncbi:MAG: hypothetical protein M3071_03080 [Actinomycetota bacterium]|nr:hypothetical protein [Actinomycetota bacterium]
MKTNNPHRIGALQRLEAFVGAWREEVAGADGNAGTMTFEWALDRQFLLQRSELADPEFPDSFGIIAVAEDGSYTQHYFDSRGVVRVYAMDLTDGTWTLVRDAPDFTPLDFSQRFIGKFAPDGATITGAWQTATDGGDWQRDFDLTYTRIK